MTLLRLLWHDYRYFEYERTLARREVRQVFGVEAFDTEDGLALPTRSHVHIDPARLTYFKAVLGETTCIVPDQAKLEACGNGNGSSWNAETQPIPRLRRQSTRYSAHGLHEYRGKFNPQVVRAIGNLFALPDRAWVLDPFCGSGTTLLEAAHIGWNALGIEINPLAVLIANAKVGAFNSSPSVLQRECDSLVRRLDGAGDGSDWQHQLPEPTYLAKWFPVSVLRQLRVILAAIERVTPASLRNVFLAILSDICREVSLQDPGDLRIRRRKDPAETYPAVEMFIDSMCVKVGSILRARQHVQPKSGTTQRALLADARATDRAIAPFMKNGRPRFFDAAITSPPYATAMPYLDTQRLSLALLNLIPSRELRHAEGALIGNREIGNKGRMVLEEQIRVNAECLPPPAIAFCRHLLEQADHRSSGFRRRNVPALVYKYLSDMALMFSSMRNNMRAKAPYALLVGRNTTELRGKKVVIDTPQLLVAVAASRGWLLDEIAPLETYHRFDVHQSNSIREEVLLVLRRK